MRKGGLQVRKPCVLYPVQAKRRRSGAAAGAYGRSAQPFRSRRPADPDRPGGRPRRPSPAAALARLSAGKRVRQAVRYLPHRGDRGDRKSVGEGKRVSVRLDLGGRRIIKKKK